MPPVPKLRHRAVLAAASAAGAAGKALRGGLGLLGVGALAFAAYDTWGRAAAATVIGGALILIDWSRR